jgi:hypothetical protein
MSLGCGKHMPKTASIILDGKSVLGLSIFFTIDAFK